MPSPVAVRLRWLLEIRIPPYPPSLASLSNVVGDIRYKSILSIHHAAQCASLIVALRVTSFSKVRYTIQSNGTTSLISLMQLQIAIFRYPKNNPKHKNPPDAPIKPIIPKKFVLKYSLSVPLCIIGKGYITQ